MAQTGIKGVRAAFADAQARLARAAERIDPPPEQERAGHRAGQWPGAPRERLPPECPVVPLGIDGKVSWFVDSVGQLIDVATAEWSKKMLLQLFCATPNYVDWAWPRFSQPKKGKPSMINGVDVDDACACLMKSAAARGLFSPMDVVRGRGAWTDRLGRIVWHSGEALWMVEGAKLKVSPTGEIDGRFYPRRPAILEPWPEPVDPADSPARRIFDILTSWSWERPRLDPVIVLGAIGAMLIGGALPWRPHVAAMGDKGVGKSQLNHLIKGIIDTGLHDTGNTTAAGIYQRVGLDTLPVAVDEFEASEDNRRNNAIVELMRNAASGSTMYRGGQDHQGIAFKMHNAFFVSGINLPPMKPQDRSRIAILNLGKLRVTEKKPPTVPAESGRMILRALMDAWPRFHERFSDWCDVLRDARMEGRAQDVYGTLFAIAELLLGIEAMEDIGLPVTEGARLGEMIALATAGERGDILDNWRGCLEHLLGATIDAWKGGEKPTIGGLFEQLEKHELDLKYARERLAAAGCGIVEEADAALPAGHRRYLLAVPGSSPALQRLFQGSRWIDGVWTGALRQGPAEIVIRDRGNRQVVKINRVSCRCLLIDLKAYDRMMDGE